MGRFYEWSEVKKLATEKTVSCFGKQIDLTALKIKKNKKGLEEEYLTGPFFDGE